MWLLVVTTSGSTAQDAYVYFIDLNHMDMPQIRSALWQPPLTDIVKSLLAFYLTI